ncbi:hypothetical protein [Microbispora sp. NBRC 16548]|uniref:hypothetical protein n=1 Tax=Microbispora sp. NBRC 16548 TaxID=3030994 RepID=UPI0024A55FD7|nr:hypothetical protein [Microbispora sp. NBRC 16548]GLX03308.1 hypothetical protein Misp03_02350 [Microbispora sp. NBRC 16548]
MHHDEVVIPMFSWNEWAQRVYLTALGRELRHALFSLQEIRHRVASDPKDPLIWFAVEGLLNHAGKVSMLLNPVKGESGREKRGEYLRVLLEVPDDSPVFDRRVRNANAHYDERLDTWVAQQPRLTAEQLEREGWPALPPPPIRRIDEATWSVTVAGETLDLTMLEEELRRLLRRSAELEPLNTLEHPEIPTLLAGLPAIPPELRFDAPTRRPDEKVTTMPSQNEHPE